MKAPALAKMVLRLAPRQRRCNETRELDVRIVGKPMGNGNGVVGNEIRSLKSSCFFEQEVPEIIRDVYFFILRCLLRHRTQNWS